MQYNLNNLNNLNNINNGNNHNNSSFQQKQTSIYPSISLKNDQKSITNINKITNNQTNANNQNKGVSLIMKTSGIWPQQQSNTHQNYNSKSRNINTIKSTIINSNEPNFNNNNNTNNKNQGSNHNIYTNNNTNTNGNYVLNTNHNTNHNHSYIRNSNQIHQNYNQKNLINNSSINKNNQSKPLLHQRPNLDMIKSSIYNYNNVDQNNQPHKDLNLNNHSHTLSNNLNNTHQNHQNHITSNYSNQNTKSPSYKIIAKPMKTSVILGNSSKQYDQSNSCGNFTHAFYQINNYNQNNHNNHNNSLNNFYNNKPNQNLTFDNGIKKKPYYRTQSLNPNVSQFMLSSPHKINDSEEIDFDSINEKVTQNQKSKTINTLMKIGKYAQSPNGKKCSISFEDISKLNQNEKDKMPMKSGVHFTTPKKEKVDYTTAPPSTPLIDKHTSNTIFNQHFISNPNLSNQNTYQSPISARYTKTNSIQSNQKSKHKQKRSSIENCNGGNENSKSNNIESNLPSILQMMAKNISQQKQEQDIPNNSSRQKGFKKQMNQKYDSPTQKDSKYQRQTKGSLRTSGGSKSKQITLQNFTILKHLGTGKYGKVYLARQIHTNFICALKQIQKKILHQQQITGQFIRQLKIQMFLNHPNIIKMYGFFSDEDNIYIILQAGTGGQLYHLLKKMANTNPTTAGLPQSKVAYYMRQVCQAVKQLHNHQIIHRDIKPQNIVIHDNVIKLCDFGWSVRQDSQLRTTFCGTPLYVCPQILKGKQYDQKIDIWSLGIMMYEMVVGQNPFKITKQQELIKIIKDQVKLPQYAKISKDIQDLLNKCLRKNPNDRAQIRQILQHQFFKKYPDKQMEKNKMAGLC